ncbi:MAG: hypothetical protein ACLR9C_15125 [Mediterraneibacter gnavus]
MKILLFSDRKKVFEITNNITKGWSELIWYKNTDLERKQYPIADIVIIDFDKNAEEKFLSIIKAKSKIENFVSVLAIINGTPQEIFSVLQAGAYDYITTTGDIEAYRSKIEDIIRWNWYRKKYGRE